MFILQRKRGIAPVVSSILLTASLLIIGSAVWSYVLGASQVLADEYVEDTLELIYEITERRIQFDTGLNKDTIKNGFKSFANHKKAFYINNYVLLKNFLKIRNLILIMKMGFNKDFIK